MLKVMGSISLTFYAMLLRAQIPKAQKYSQAIGLFFTFGIFVRKSFA